MKISFVFTDDRGKEYEGSAELVPVHPTRKTRSGSVIKPPASTVRLSFELNLRAFMRRYSGGLQGDQKFTLLLARLAKGDSSKRVSFDEIRTQWNRMKTVMGGRFIAAYSNRAKEHGWVDTPRRGEYILSAQWKEALEKSR